MVTVLPGQKILASHVNEKLVKDGTDAMTGDLLPNGSGTLDIGDGAAKWKDGYFSGKLYIDGGIDPTYIQLDPQAVAPAINNILWIDSLDSNTLKHRNNGGTSVHVNTEEITIIPSGITNPTPAVAGQLFYNTADQKVNVYGAAWGAIANLAYQVSSGTTDISTNSTSYVDMNSMSITVAAAGTYLVLAQATIRTDNGGGTGAALGKARLYQNTTQLIETNFGSNAATNNGAWVPVVLMYVATFAASDTIKMQWALTNGTQILNYAATQPMSRRISIIKIA
jgi:hypothetical protein